MIPLPYIPIIISIIVLFYLLLRSSKALKNTFKSKRLIEDTPTSKARSAAIGSDVEFKGLCTTHDNNALVAPISNKKCAAYIWKITRHEPVHQEEYTCLYFYSDKYIFIKNDENKMAALNLSLINIKDLEFNEKQKYWRHEDIPKDPLRVFCKYPDLFNELDFESNIFLQYYCVEEAIISPNRVSYILGNTTFPDKICDKKEWLNTKRTGNESQFSVSKTLLNKLNVLIEPRTNKQYVYFSQQNEESIIFQHQIKVVLLIIATIIALILLYLYLVTASYLAMVLFGIIIMFLAYAHFIPAIKSEYKKSKNFITRDKK